MQEKKILKKYDMFLRTKYFIVIEGYNPRIHALYLCPQLFRHDTDKLVPLEGEEIGELIARSVEAGAPERCPWYDPMEPLPQEPLFDSAMEMCPRRGVFASRRTAVVGPAWPVGRSLLIQERTPNKSGIAFRSPATKTGRSESASRATAESARGMLFWVSRVALGF